INYFLFDNNILWTLMKDRTPEQKKISNWTQGLATYGLCPKPRDVKFIITSFSFLECIKPTKIIEVPTIKIAPGTLATNDIGKIQHEIYTQAYSFYSQLDWLQAEALHKASAHQKTFATKDGKEF